MILMKNRKGNNIQNSGEVTNLSILCMNLGIPYLSVGNYNF